MKKILSLILPFFLSACGNSNGVQRQLESTNNLLENNPTCFYLESKFPDWESKTIQELINYFVSLGDRLAWRLGVARDELGIPLNMNMEKVLGQFGNNSYFDKGLGKNTTLYDAVCTDQSNIYPSGFNFEFFQHNLSTASLRETINTITNVLGATMSLVALTYLAYISYRQTSLSINGVGLKETMRLALDAVVTPYREVAKEIGLKLKTIYDSCLFRLKPKEQLALSY